jgi:hypothetical protein
LVQIKKYIKIPIDFFSDYIKIILDLLNHPERKNIDITSLQMGIIGGR